MKLTLEVWLTAELEESRESEKIAIEAEHELTKEDLEEFVDSIGFKNYIEYFKSCGYDSEDLEEIEKNINDGNLFLVEQYIEAQDKRALHDDLAVKYQKDLLKTFFEKLTDSCLNITVEA